MRASTRTTLGDFESHKKRKASHHNDAFQKYFLTFGVNFDIIQI